MVRTKEDGTVVSGEAVKTEIKSRVPIIKNKEKTSMQSINIDKSSFGIGFFISACIFIMFMVGCIVGSSMM